MHTHPCGQPLRLAFIGCGLITRMHSRTLRHVGAAVERFYASRSRAKAEEFNRRYRGQGFFGSYEDALADERITAVLIATPPATHLELTLAALGAGKHVIVEKPPFLRATDIDRVEEAQASAGRRVFVAENYYYKPLARALREVLASGTIGEARILSVNALKRQERADWRDRADLAGGGALFEGGIHWINFMANLGLHVTRVHGFRPGPPSAPERSMLVVFQYAQGAVGTLYHSWEIGSPLRGLRLSAIYGTRGTVTFESNGLFLAVRGTRTRLWLPDPRDLLGYRAMFEDFIDAFRMGTPPRFSLAAARRDLELLEQVYASTEDDGPSSKRRSR